MRSVSRVVGLIAGAGIALLAACSGSDATAPTEDHPAIPELAQSNNNCAVWSCSWIDCGRDPAIYGACCKTITDDGDPGVPKPANCDAPPDETPGYCNAANAVDACYAKAMYDGGSIFPCSTGTYRDNNGDPIGREEPGFHELFPACPQ